MTQGSPVLEGLRRDGELAQHLHAEPGPGSVPLQEWSLGWELLEEASGPVSGGAGIAWALWPCLQGLAGQGQCWCGWVDLLPCPSAAASVLIWSKSGEVCPSQPFD